MARSHSRKRKHQLARWVAEGGTVAAWCAAHGIARQTAYHWYQADWFQSLVEAQRRHIVDRAIDQLAEDFGKAFGTRARRAGRGQDDSTTLPAVQGVLHPMRMRNVPSLVQLKARIRRLEQRFAKGCSGESG